MNASPDDLNLTPADPEEAALRQAIQAALQPAARPMTAAQIEQVVVLAAQRSGRFPVWALLAWAIGLAGLACAALTLPGLPDPVRSLAFALPAINLIAAPFASLAIIFRRRKTHVSQA